MTKDVHPSLLKRKIIHFDMDAFYASVEMRDDPSLRGKPLIVGGSPNSRGVVCTASYEARKFGVHSAMACAHAARLCPQAIFIKPDFGKYSAASREIRAVFAQYTDLIEPLSLDEAYLDVTNNAQGLYAVKIARLIQDEVFARTALTGSAGVAPNKLVAKIASDVHKPRGITVVVPEQVETFMGGLKLRKIHGIGPSTEKRLTEQGLYTCRDVWAMAIDELNERVGQRMAEWLYQRSRGIDERPVTVERVRKSLGREDTFRSDLLDLAALKAEIARVSGEVAGDLAQRRLKGRTITLKVRYDDFSRITRSHSLSEAVADEATIRDVATNLLDDTEAGRRKIRLLGVSLSNLET